MAARKWARRVRCPSGSPRRREMNSTRSRSRCTRKERAEPGEGMDFIPLLLCRRDDGKTSTLDNLKRAVCVRACGDRDRCHVTTGGLQLV